MKKSSKDIAKCVLKKMKESDKKLGLAKKAYDYVGDEARQALLEHNKRELGEAGGLLGMSTGGLGGALLGTGAGLLASRFRPGLTPGRGAGYGALAGLLGGGIAGGIAGPYWGRSKAEEITNQDVDQLNQLAEQQYQQELAQQQAQMQEMRRQQMLQYHQAMGNYLQSPDSGGYGQQYPAMGKYSAVQAFQKFSEVDPVPVPDDEQESVSTPPGRNNFFAPHITGDFGHQMHGYERSLQRTPALPREGVTDVVYNR